jgi:HAD superfamily hydrolase (TIGR01490 family)
METTFSKDHNPGNSHIAFFDLDRTIIKAISGKALVTGAYKRGLLSHSGLVRALYLSILYKLSFKDPLKVINDMTGWVKGIPEKTIADLCFEVFRDVLLPSVFEEARAEILFRKENYAKIVMLSSSITYVCNSAAKALEMDDIICSELEVKEGVMTGEPIGRICFGEEKAVRMREYCEKNNAIISDAWYYGDSISDLAALSASGHPVCVNPDNKLKREAQKRGWKILYWSD